MHHHLYYLAALPATGLAVLGYVALYCARNSQGRMQTAGKILAAWAFLLAILVVVVAVTHPASDRPLGPHGHFGRLDESPKMEPAMRGDETAPAPPAAEAPPPVSMPEPQSSNPTGWTTE